MHRILTYIVSPEYRVTRDNRDILISFYHTLVDIGLWKDVLAWVVGFVCALAFTYVRKIRFLNKLDVLIDRLDADTDGGINTLHKDLQHLISHVDNNNHNVR